ncbi:hypothetical protein EWM64_g8076 [Hericium alpestre]|uniref:BTB domain-containing protein n=1 Tax=Hericium alpestre TaxID=135208 RepID=A0A4Y9ZM48_9AGAM|nr:hypothetical protein EWM64_g8076 [Hericium alpestre]
MADAADTSFLPPSVREPRVAEEPFNDTSADVILRTSDKVDFYVYKNVLSLASPFFKDMFSLPQPKLASDASIGDGHTVSAPIVDVSEDSRTLDFVLHFCYPVRRPSMIKLTDVGPVLLAAFKYDVNVVLAVAKVALEQCIEQDILGAFALAFRCELYDVCSKAAGHLGQLPFLSLDSKELEFIKADKYRQLLNYQLCYTKDRNTVMPSWDDRPPNLFSGGLVLPKGSLFSGCLLADFKSLDLPQDAVTPFDDKTADIVLRSSDRIHFHVHSFILSFASPVFKDMILNHQKAQRVSACSAPDDSTVINVPEDSHTLDFVLRRCYPVRLPRLSDFDEARRVLAAGVKYDIDGVKAVAEAALVELMDQDIIGVWSIAVRYRLRDVCIVAARRSFQHPGVSLNSSELRYVSASQYHQLLQYRKSCDTTPITSSIQEPRVADKPFDNRAADVILRTSDRVDFYVYKSILSLASPVFEDMFCLPQSPLPLPTSIEDPTSTHRVIDVKEEAHTLDSILRYCYPIYRPPLTTLQEVRDVLDAAHQYRMIAVTSIVKYALIKFIDGHELDVFAIAIACEGYDVCTKAAQKFVQHPFLSLDSKELGRISARQYHRLLNYHEQYTADEYTAVSVEIWAPGARYDF